MSTPSGPARGVTPGLPTNTGSFKATERDESGVNLATDDLDPQIQAKIDEAFQAGIEEGLRRAETQDGSAVPEMPEADKSENVCTECEGTGYDHPVNPEKTLWAGQCATCGGSGQDERDPATGFHCESCKGEGWEWDTEGRVDCHVCGGPGKIPGTPAGRDEVYVTGHGEFHRRRGDVFPDWPYAMRLEADRPITDDEMRHMAQLIGYAYRATVRGESLPDPVRDSDRSFVLHADTTKTASDDIGVALDAFECNLPDLLREGSPVRKTERAGVGTKGTRLVEGLGASAPRIEIYYDSVVGAERLAR